MDDLKAGYCIGGCGRASAVGSMWCEYGPGDHDPMDVVFPAVMEEGDDHLH